MASWLLRSTSEQAVQIRVLAGDIVLCSWARQFTVTVPLSTQVYKKTGISSGSYESVGYKASLFILLGGERYCESQGCCPRAVNTVSPAKLALRMSTLTKRPPCLPQAAKEHKNLFTHKGFYISCFKLSRVKLKQ